MKELVNPLKCNISGITINYFREGHGEVGHFIQLDEPEKLAHILLQFLKEKSYAA